MEHRHGTRRYLPFTLRVILDNSQALYSLTNNISQDGLFMRLTHPQLHRHAFITLELYNSARNSTWRTQAMVIHSSSEGTGVLFANSLPQWFNIGDADEGKSDQSSQKQRYAQSN